MIKRTWPPLGGGDDDDNSFVSIADFFSLLSIAFIYFAMFFGSASSINQAARVSQFINPGAGSVLRYDPTVAYLALFTRGSDVVIRVVDSNNRFQEMSVAFGVAEVADAERWVRDEIGSSAEVKTVIVRMDSEQASKEVFWLRDELARRLSRDFDVRLML